MATLQAARAYVLGFSLEEAKSFGLNRAIFYAAAKKGFKSLRGFKGKVKFPRWKLIRKFSENEIKEIEKNFSIERLGDEMAYCVRVNNQRLFVIGEEIQTPEDFEKQVETRFKGKFEEAWRQALEIVKSYDKGVLLSQRYFYEAVYKPRRDELVEKWSQLLK